MIPILRQVVHILKARVRSCRRLGIALPPSWALLPQRKLPCWFDIANLFSNRREEWITWLFLRSLIRVLDKHGHILRVRGAHARRSHAFCVRLADLSLWYRIARLLSLCLWVAWLPLWVRRSCSLGVGRPHPGACRGKRALIPRNKWRWLYFINGRLTLVTEWLWLLLKCVVIIFAANLISLNVLILQHKIINGHEAAANADK